MLSDLSSYTGLRPLIHSMVGVGVGVGVGRGLLGTEPFLQMSLVPLLVHVNFLPATVDVWPTFLQIPPALMAAVASKGAINAKTMVRESRVLFIVEVSDFFVKIASIKIEYAYSL